MAVLVQGTSAGAGGSSLSTPRPSRWQHQDSTGGASELTLAAEPFCRRGAGMPGLGTILGCVHFAGKLGANWEQKGWMPRGCNREGLTQVE